MDTDSSAATAAEQRMRDAADELERSLRALELELPAVVVRAHRAVVNEYLDALEARLKEAVANAR